MSWEGQLRYYVRLYLQLKRPRSYTLNHSARVSERDFARVGNGISGTRWTRWMSLLYLGVEDFLSTHGMGSGTPFHFH